MGVVELKPEDSGRFVCGSTVELKGGGIVMTVRRPGKQVVLCDWHDSDGVDREKTYHPDMLRHADQDEEGKDGGG